MDFKKVTPPFKGLLLLPTFHSHPHILFHLGLCTKPQVAGFRVKCHMSFSIYQSLNKNYQRFQNNQGHRHILAKELIWLAYQQKKINGKCWMVDFKSFRNIRVFQLGKQCLILLKSTINLQLLYVARCWSSTELQRASAVVHVCLSLFNTMPCNIMYSS